MARHAAASFVNNKGGGRARSMRLLVSAVAAVWAVLSVVALMRHAHPDTVRAERVQLTTAPSHAVSGLADYQLRADTLPLEGQMVQGDLKFPVKSSVARAKKLAAAKRRKADKRSEDTEEELSHVTKEVGMLTTFVTKFAGNVKPTAPKQREAVNSSEDISSDLSKVEKEVGMLTKVVMKKIPRPKMQILRREYSRAGGESSSGAADGSGPALELPVDAHRLDKLHCFLPDVWSRGQCRSDPRGNRVLQREYQRFCGDDEDVPKCKTYQSRYVSA